MRHEWREPAVPQCNSKAPALPGRLWRTAKITIRNKRNRNHTPVTLIVLNAGRMANKSNGKSACPPRHRFILPCGITSGPFSLAHEIDCPGAVADDAGAVSRNLVSSSSRRSGVNECWLIAARTGRISRRNEPNIAIFGSKTADFRAKWDARKSVNYVWAAEINYARLGRGGAGPCGRKLLIYSLVWVLRNKPNFHQILTNACRTGRTGLQRSVA